MGEQMARGPECAAPSCRELPEWFGRTGSCPAGGKSKQSSVHCIKGRSTSPTLRIYFVPDEGQPKELEEACQLQIAEQHKLVSHPNEYCPEDACINDKYWNDEHAYPAAMMRPRSFP